MRARPTRKTGESPERPSERFAQDDGGEKKQIPRGAKATSSDDNK